MNFDLFEIVDVMKHGDVHEKARERVRFLMDKYDIVAPVFRDYPEYPKIDLTTAYVTAALASTFQVYGLASARYAAQGMTVMAHLNARTFAISGMLIAVKSDRGRGRKCWFLSIGRGAFMRMPLDPREFFGDALWKYFEDLDIGKLRYVPRFAGCEEAFEEPFEENTFGLWMSRCRVCGCDTPHYSLSDECKACASFQPRRSKICFSISTDKNTLESLGFVI